MRRTLFYRCGQGLVLAAITVFFAGTALAQTGRVEGTVRSAQAADPIPGARVSIVGTALAATTNANGYYAVENVPVGTYNVRVNVIGFQSATITNQLVAAGLPTTVNFSLNRSILRIEGIVVTGVAEATQAVKLPFTVDQVTTDDLPVPATSAEESIRGKVAGARVIKGSGLPGSGTSVLLRGATSINTSGRTNEPLYVVDGVILGASMVDVDALDIREIEVVKGAAASALFGARAANGVVHIKTQRGTNVPEGETRITWRSEFGRNSLQRQMPATERHHYHVDATGTQWADATGAPLTTFDTTFNADGTINIRDDNVLSITNPRNSRVVDFVTDSTDFDGDGVFAVHTYAIQDNEYPTPLFDQLDRFFDPGSFYTHSFSVAHRTGSTNFRASFHETKQSGVVLGLDGYLRRGARINVDHKIGRTIDFTASAYYSRSEADDPDNQNGPNPFFSLPRLEPDVDYFERYPESQKKVDLGTATSRDSLDFLLMPDPSILEENPNYVSQNQERERLRGRFLGSFAVRWRPVDEFDFDVAFSYDRSDRNETQFWFIGYRTFDPSILNDGRLRKINRFTQAVNASATATWTKRFGDFGTVTRVRALLERASDESITARSTDLVVDNVRDLDNSDADLQRVFGSTEEVRSVGYFASTQLDYKERYVGDFLIRRDGSSLFGADQRWHWYYRASAAWRMSEEPWWPITALDEFKLRFSRGTAGGRPRFDAQYETYDISANLVSKGTLGNKLLKPERATENEFGVDLLALGRFALSVNYAESTIEDQLLEVPLAGFNGFTSQWRNGGTLKSKSWEGTLQASIIQKPDVAWSLNFVIDRTRSTIVAVDTTIPPYQTGYFNIREGLELGTIFGNRWASECGEILTDGGFGAACDQFDLNDDGYLVPVGTGNVWTDGIDKNLYGSKITIDGVTYDWGIPVKTQEERTQNLPNGIVQVDTTDFVVMGNTAPDFNFGVANTIRWKGFSLYALFDAQIGGDIYNQTRQWGCRDATCWEYDQATQDGEFASGSPGMPENHKKSILYPEILYNVNDNSSHFIEDGTYLKFRELALRYTFTRSQLEGVFGSFINRISLSVIGRNLATFTGYTGYDPEVSSQGNESALLRIDEFGYPNFRTWTGAVEIEF